MRIGLNGLLLGRGADYRQTGVSRYIARLCDTLPTALPDEVSPGAQRRNPKPVPACARGAVDTVEPVI